MATTNQARMVKWLETTAAKNVRNVRPIRVTFLIGPKTIVTMYGAEYESVRTRVAAEREVTEGRAKEGDEYTERRLAIAGMRPKAMTLKDRTGCGKICWRMEGDFTESDWHPSWYWEGGKTKYAPVGPEFSMGRWPHELPYMGRIDQYETPRQRRTFRVEYVKETNAK